MDSDHLEPIENEQNELDTDDVFSYDKYLNQLDLNHFANYTERLIALKEFTRSYVPHMSDYIKNGVDSTFAAEVPPEIKQAASRALIAAFNQISRICEKDLEPISVLFDGENSESDEYDPNDDYFG